MPTPERIQKSSSDHVGSAVAVAFASHLDRSDEASFPVMGRGLRSRVGALHRHGMTERSIQQRCVPFGCSSVVSRVLLVVSTWLALARTLILGHCAKTCVLGKRCVRES